MVAEGALRTCSARVVAENTKSSTSRPSWPGAWARTPANVAELDPAALAAGEGDGQGFARDQHRGARMPFTEGDDLCNRAFSDITYPDPL